MLKRLTGKSQRLTVLFAHYLVDAGWQIDSQCEDGCVADKNGYVFVFNSSEIEQDRCVIKFCDNPKKTAWHIERNGNVIFSGGGVDKYFDCPDITRDFEKNLYDNFLALPKDKYLMNRVSNMSPKPDSNTMKEMYEKDAERFAILPEFRKFLDKIDGIACETYRSRQILNNIAKARKKNGEKSTIKYMAAETEQGKIEKGQCFIAKELFSNGVEPGDVFRIVDVDHGFCYALRLSKITGKELENILIPGNHLWFESKDFAYWLSEDKVAYCTFGLL